MARRRKEQSDLITNLLSQLGIVSGAIWHLIVGKRTVRLAKKRYQEHWQKIARLVDQQAILEADKLVDQAFQELGLAGRTFADRLRAAEPKMSHQTYQALWEAHRFRNQIAHELGYKLSQGAAHQALQNFKRGLRALGAL